MYVRLFCTIINPPIIVRMYKNEEILKFLFWVCVTTSDKPGQTDRLMSVYVGKKKNKPPKTLSIAQNQNLMI